MNDSIILNASSGKLIRCDYQCETGNYLPSIGDLADAAGLSLLGNEGNIKHLFELLLNEKYKTAVKWAANLQDDTLRNASAKIGVYLCLSMGSSFVLNTDFNHNRTVFTDLKPLVCGVAGLEMTEEQVLNLVQSLFPGYILNVHLAT